MHAYIYIYIILYLYLLYIFIQMSLLRIYKSCISIHIYLSNVQIAYDHFVGFQQLLNPSHPSSKASVSGVFASTPGWRGKLPGREAPVG